MKHVQIRKDGIPRYGINTPTITIDGVGGKVVAYVGSDIECYSEFFVDFIADDGRVMQLACVGQRHEGPDFEPTMHGDVWNGVDECSTHNHEIEVSDESYWYDYAVNENGVW